VILFLFGLILIQIKNKDFQYFSNIFVAINAKYSLIDLFSTFHYGSKILSNARNI
jgi:hypothetical protein